MFGFWGSSNRSLLPLNSPTATTVPTRAVKCADIQGVPVALYCGTRYKNHLKLLGKYFLFQGQGGRIVR